MAPNAAAQALSEPDEAIHVDPATLLQLPNIPADEPPSRQLDGDTMAALACSLFELRAACEAQLRTLTSLQRHLERVRRLGSHTPEADLLLTEIDRQLRELQNGSLDVAQRHGIAARTFLQVKPANGE